MVGLSGEVGGKKLEEFFFFLVTMFPGSGPNLLRCVRRECGKEEGRKEGYLGLASSPLKFRRELCIHDQ
jgi:hypothetical protein